MFIVAAQVPKDHLDYSQLSEMSQAVMPVMIYPPHTPGSLLNRVKTLPARISKIVAIEAVTEMESTWDDDDFYDACKTIYMNHTQSVAILMTFVQ
jgi:hypothetical protein